MREGIHGTRGACVSMVSKVPTLPMVSEVSLTGFQLEKWMRGEVKGLHATVRPLGHALPENFFSHFRPFEITSGAFSDIFGFQMTW